LSSGLGVPPARLHSCVLGIPPLGQLALERWVQTTGGEYFFQPSVSALLQLGG